MGDEPGRLELARDGDVLVVTGELDAFASESLVDAFGAARDVPTLTVDVSGVGFIDSSALRALVVEQQRRESTGQTLTLRSPSDAVRRLLEVTGLSGVFALDDAAPA